MERFERAALGGDGRLSSLWYLRAAGYRRSGASASVERRSTTEEKRLGVSRGTHSERWRPHAGSATCERCCIASRAQKLMLAPRFKRR